ncbi:MAG TPA: patatin-like phospholipase family protein [Pirellulales bacterium]
MPRPPLVSTARAAPRTFALCATLCVASGLGCVQVQHTGPCVPTGLLTPDATVDLNSTTEGHHSLEREVLTETLTRLKSTRSPELASNAKKYNALALSGGGSYGAFSAGVLNGWTASGQRPQFDIVSGVSTGALIATYAFLGPRYDEALRKFYTTTTTADVYHKRFKPAVLWSDSFVSSTPLQCAIERGVSPQLLCEVAQAHAEGRRLFIGTTNLDTGRLVIWDMGAIASKGDPESLVLYRKIILASASAPGFFPPVNIDVSVNGQSYSEMHVDGGTTAQVFFRSSMLQIDPAEFSGGRRPLTGSRVYVVVAGKAFPDPKCIEDRALKIASRSLSALTHAQTRNDLVRIYTLTMLTGMDFRVAAIPQDWPIQEDGMVFDEASMRNLYDRGYQWTVAGRAWADLPPVLDASQQSIPRAGTRFLAPLAGNLPCGT